MWFRAPKEIPELVGIYMNTVSDGITLNARILPPRCTSKVPRFAFAGPPGPSCTSASALSLGRIL